MKSIPVGKFVKVVEEIEVVYFFKLRLSEVDGVVVAMPTFVWDVHFLASHEQDEFIAFDSPFVVQYLENGVDFECGIPVALGSIMRVDVCQKPSVVLELIFDDFRGALGFQKPESKLLRAC